MDIWEANSFIFISLSSSSLCSSTIANNLSFSSSTWWTSTICTRCIFGIFRWLFDIEISLSFFNINYFSWEPSSGYELRFTILSSSSLIVNFLALAVYFKYFRRYPTLFRDSLILFSILVDFTTSTQIISLSCLKNYTLSGSLNKDQSKTCSISL